MNEETPTGQMQFDGNELRVDAKDDDASAFRGGAPPTQRTLVKFGGDVVSNGRREEVAQLSFKQSETHNVVDGRLGGEFYLGLRKPGHGSTDDAMQDIARGYPVNTHPDYPGGAVVFEVPVIAPNIGGGSNLAKRTDTMWAENGLSFTQQQSDGNFVTYVTSTPFSKDGTHVKAVWSAWHGRIVR